MKEKREKNATELVNENKFGSIFLIVEAPTQSEADAGRVHRVVRRPEVAAVRLVEVVVHHIETCAFQIKIGIDGKERVVAHFFFFQRILVHEHAYDGRIVRCIVFCKILHVSTKLGLEHLGNLETQIQVGVERYCREGKHF